MERNSRVVWVESAMVKSAQAWQMHVPCITQINALENLLSRCATHLNEDATIDCLGFLLGGCFSWSLFRSHQMNYLKPAVSYPTPTWPPSPDERFPSLTPPDELVGFISPGVYLTVTLPEMVQRHREVTIDSLAPNSVCSFKLEV